MPGGTYRLSSAITVPFSADPPNPSYSFAPTLHLVGDGPDVTIIRRATGGTHDLLHIERSFTTVSSMTFDGDDGSTTDGDGIVIGQPLVAGTNDGRVFRRIQLQNLVVRNCARRLLWVLGGLSNAPISILSRYTDCVFAANKQTGTSPIYAAVDVAPRSTTQYFRGVHITQFKGYGLRLDGCSGVSFIDGRIDFNSSALYPYAFLKDADSCHIDGTSFEEQTAEEAIQWFIEMDSNCTGSSTSGCFFKRKRNVSKAVRVGPTGPSRGVLVLDPHVRLPSAPASTDTPVSIEHLDSECAIFGGVMEIGADGGPFTYPALEIGDQAARSTHLAPDRRLRLPRLTGTDISGFVAANRKVSDLIHRDIETGSLRVGTGFEAWNGTNWIPLTVNRYTDLTTLGAETSRDKGTLAWVNSAPGTLRAYDGAAWWNIVRRVGAYDNSGLGAGAVTAQVAANPGGFTLYRLSVIVKVTLVPTTSQTLDVRAKWTDTDGTLHNEQIISLSMAVNNVQKNAMFVIYLGTGSDITVTVNAVGDGLYTLRTRAEVV